MNTVNAESDTLGAGLNVTTPINDSFQLRLNVNGTKYSSVDTEEDVDYDADLMRRLTLISLHHMQV